MIKEDKPKKILSKRVLIAFGIISFIVLVGAVVRIISTDDNGKIEKPVENEEDEELLEDGESEEEDLLSVFDNFPFFIAGIVAIAWVINKFFRKMI